MDTDLPRRLGRYELVRVLGRGAAGVVVQAVLHGPAGFRKRVALKLLHASHGEDEARVAELIREARLGGLLSHPNVVSTLELGQVDGRWFVSMELVRGASLSALGRDGPMSPAAVVDAGIQLCAALSHVHELRDDGDRPLRLIHRDVKPGNLLLDRSGLLRLADFGIAGLSAELGGGAAGTPGYLAPEQADGVPEQASDLFAAGMTLLTLLRGRNPLGRGSQAVFAAMAIEARTASPGFFDGCESVPGLQEVLARCLRFDPAARFPDAASLGRALRMLRPAAPGISLAELALMLEGAAAGQITEEAPVPSASAPTVTLARSDRTRLPPREGRIIGRTELLAELRVDGGGLVTLVGPAGVGKTRLALELAAGSSGARFCALPSARTEAELAALVARSLGVDVGPADPDERIALAALQAGGPVVLDNLEQAVDAARGCVARWVERAPDVRWIATSRAPLRIPGERVVEVAPLDPTASADLFAERRGRALSEEERPAVEALVEQLDGLPLAIELLAARARTLPVSTLAARLADRRRLLAGGRGADPRHQSLEAALGWSWELLDPTQQQALAQLAVFEGPFGLEAAEAVVDVGPDAPWTLDLLEALVEQHLVQVRDERFGLLVSVRDFASARLVEVGPTRERHGRWFASRGTPEAREALRRAGGARRMRDLQRELPDLLAAARGATDPAVGVPAALAAWEVLLLRGPASVGVELCDGVLALPLSDHQRALLLEARGTLRGVTGDLRGELADLQDAEPLADAGTAARLRCRRAAAYREAGRAMEALPVLEEVLAWARAHGDRSVEQRALGQLGVLHREQGRTDDAIAAQREALALARASGDTRAAGSTLANLGVALSDRGDRAGARAAYQEAHDLTAECGDRRTQAIVMANLGIQQWRAGDVHAGRASLRRALELHRRFGAQRSVAIVLANLGALERQLGDADAARASLEEAHRVHVSMGDRRSEGIALTNLALLHDDAGRHDEALDALDRAVACHVDVGNTRSEGIARVNRAAIRLRRGALAEAERDLLEASRIAVDTRHTLLEGVVLVSLGRLQRLRGDRERAREHLERAEALLGEGSDPMELARLRIEQGLAGDAAQAARRRAEVEALVGLPVPRVLRTDYDALCAATR